MVGLSLQVHGDLNLSNLGLWHASPPPASAFPLSPSPVLGVIQLCGKLACYQQQQTLLPKAAHSAITGATVWVLS